MSEDNPIKPTENNQKTHPAASKTDAKDEFFVADAPKDALKPATNAAATPSTEFSTAADANPNHATPNAASAATAKESQAFAPPKINNKEDDFDFNDINLEDLLNELDDEDDEKGGGGEQGGSPVNDLTAANSFNSSDSGTASDVQNFNEDFAINDEDDDGGDAGGETGSGGSALNASFKTALISAMPVATIAATLFGHVGHHVGTGLGAAAVVATGVAAAASGIASKISERRQARQIQEPVLASGSLLENKIGFFSHKPTLPQAEEEDDFDFNFDDEEE